jgi:ketosteroid isomerase-like protein
MNADDNKKLVRKFCEDFSRGDVDAVLAVMADNAAWRVMGSFPLAATRSKQDFGASLRSMRSLIPGGVAMTPTGLVAEGDRVAVEADAYGKLTNGKEYRNQLHLLVELRDGKITAVREYFDTMHAYELFHG